MVSLKVFRRFLILFLLTLGFFGCILPDNPGADTLCADGAKCDEAYPLCGNETIDENETCDDGNKLTEECAYGETACTICDSSCNFAAGETSFCGDGAVDTENAEECDDGNTENDTTCSGICTLPTCGDGILDEGEACDDGNDVATDTCTNQCRLPECGDGIISNNSDNDEAGTGPRETCDDNNSITETCAYGETSCTVCDANCIAIAGETSFCGDSHTDTDNGEVCDNGESNSNEIPNACRTNCGMPFCGDSVVDTGEDCDLGDENTTSVACDSTCASTPFLVTDINTDHTDNNDTFLLARLNNLLIYYRVLGEYVADIIAVNTTTNEKTVLHKYLLEYTMVNSALGSHAQTHDRFFYTRSIGSTTVELWCTDGTAEGTSMIHEFGSDGIVNLNLLSASKMVALPPIAPEAHSNAILFLGSDTEHGVELWRSEGTPETTVMMTELEAGLSDLIVDQMVVHNDKVYFSATTNAQGEELWYTQGTVETTFMLPPLGADNTGGNISQLTSTSNGLFFSATDDKSPYRLTDENTIVALMPLVSTESVEDASHYTSIGDKVVFIGETGTLGEELFVFNTDNDTVTNLADLKAGLLSSRPHSLRVTDNNLLFFVADDGTGYSLWVTDGTPDLVNKFLPNHNGIDESASYQPGSGFVSAPMGNELLFTAFQDDDDFLTLWKTSGGPNDATLLLDLPVSFMTLNQAPLTFDDAFYFSAHTETHGVEPWSSDGTVEGTQMIVDLNEAASSNRSFTSPVSLGDKILFVAYSPSAATGLYVSDGTDAGTYFIKDLLGTDNTAPPLLLGTSENHAYFGIDDEEHGRELWCSDGTAGGTLRVKDIFPGETGGVQHNRGIYFQDHFFFVAQDSEDVGYELWKTDCTEDGTLMVKDIYSGDDNSYPSDFIEYQNKLYFSARSDGRGVEIWFTDGTEAGTELLEDLYAGSSSSSPDNFAVIGDRLFFSARSAATGRELWVYDGNAIAGLPEVGAGNLSGFNKFIGVYNDYYYFVGFSPNEGAEIWKTNGADNLLVTDLYPGTVSSNPDPVALSGNKFIFYATTEELGKALWAVDLDSEDSQMILELQPGAADDQATVLGTLSQGDGVSYISLVTPAHGSEVWRTDGTLEGTRKQFDILEERWALPLGLTNLSDHILFFANDGIHGFELWRYNYPTTP